MASVRRVLVALLDLAWVVTVLCWPVLKWLFGLDVFIQLLRALFAQTWIDWARWFAHFAVFTAASWFATFYRPESTNPPNASGS